MSHKYGWRRATDPSLLTSEDFEIVPNISTLSWLVETKPPRDVTEFRDDTHRNTATDVVDTTSHEGVDIIVVTKD
jgi:hypothetical protein